MCLDCWEDEGKPYRVTNAVRKWAPKFGAADEFGALHIVVGDWNLEDRDLEFCLNQADITTEEIMLMKAMQLMTREERWATAILGQHPEVATNMVISDGERRD